MGSIRTGRRESPASLEIDQEGFARGDWMIDTAWRR